MQPNTAIETHGLTKTYGKHQALIDLDLVVPRGIVFGYLGPNGAGKTTTMKLLTGLIRPTTGEARVFGLDVASRRDEVQSTIGYLPGDFSGYTDQTAEQFLRLIGALRGGVDWAGVRSLADRFHLDLKRRIGTLSHGNRQKVGIVQAFMNIPPLLILDEPTQGLDPLMQREFLALVREVRDAGQTVLLSSHVLSEVEAVADWVGILGEGQLLTTVSMGQLRAGARRRIDLEFAGEVPSAEISRAQGVHDLQVRDHTAHITLTGSTAELLRVAAPHTIVAVTTHESDLVDAFLGFYDVERNTPDALDLSEGPLGPAPQPAGLG